MLYTDVVKETLITFFGLTADQIQMDNQVAVMIGDGFGTSVNFRVLAAQDADAYLITDAFDAVFSPIGTNASDHATWPNTTSPIVQAFQEAGLDGIFCVN